jgi:hypothetical protein
MAAIPERREMRVPLVSERKNEILQVTMIWSADDKMASGPKHLLSEARQVTRSNKVFDYLSSNSHVKALVANRRWLVVYSDLVKHQFRRRTLCEPNAVGTRLAAHDFVSVSGQLAA